MKSKTRKEALRVYGHLYHKHFHQRHEQSGGCYYCGEPNDGFDHCPPVSWAENLALMKQRREVEFLTVPCCVQCNTRLADRPLFTLYERTKHLEKYLLDKYDRVKALWSDEEIREMGSEFQRTIKARRVKDELLLMRARHAQWRLVQIEVGDEQGAI